MKSLKIILKDESGQALVEYGLIIALVVIAAISVITVLGTTIRTTLYDNITIKLGEIISGF